MNIKRFVFSVSTIILFALLWNGRVCMLILA